MITAISATRSRRLLIARRRSSTRRPPHTAHQPAIPASSPPSSTLSHPAKGCHAASGPAFAARRAAWAATMHAIDRHARPVLTSLGAEDDRLRTPTPAVALPFISAPALQRRRSLRPCISFLRVLRLPCLRCSITMAMFAIPVQMTGSGE